MLDEGQNSEIAYSIPDINPNFPLAVDARTGWIHTTRALDREEQSLYKFQVVAVDGGVIPKSASSSVVITIQDVNDNDPSFSPKYYEATISEDQSPGIYILNNTMFFFKTFLDTQSCFKFNIYRSTRNRIFKCYKFKIISIKTNYKQEAVSASFLFNFIVNLCPLVFCDFQKKVLATVYFFYFYEKKIIIWTKIYS